MTAAQPRSGEDTQGFLSAATAGEGVNAGGEAPSAASTDRGPVREGAAVGGRPLPADPEAHARRAQSLARDAMNLACMVRDEEPPVVWAWLAGRDRRDVDDLCVALAAMVPIDRRPSELLAWTADLEPALAVARRAQAATARSRAQRATARTAQPKRGPSAAERVLAEGGKRCPRCEDFKPPSGFYPEPNRASGLSGWCRKCKNGRRLAAS